jgi:hypothetical protein
MAEPDRSQANAKLIFRSVLTADGPDRTVHGRAGKRAPTQACQLCLDAIFNGPLETLADSSGVLAFTFLLSIGAVLKESSIYPISDGATSPADLPMWTFAVP